MQTNKKPLLRLTTSPHNVFLESFWPKIIQIVVKRDRTSFDIKKNEWKC